MDDAKQRRPFRQTLALGVTLAAALTLGGVAPAASAAAQNAPGTARPITWTACAQDPAAECGVLALPVDWADPAGPTFGLAVARRPATGPGDRIGTLVYGPGGPGNSGVDQVVTGMGRFSGQLRARFDIVSFDPRGVGRSNPVVCSPQVQAQQPVLLPVTRAEFEATRAYNRRLRADCRHRTGPLFDHLDSLSMAHDVEALRAALKEPRLTFYGSSYGTVLGAQYAERYPHRVRAMALESVVDHSAATGAFLNTQAAGLQDSFEEFVAWCGRTSSCALHDRDVRALWAGLLDRAGRAKLGNYTPALLILEAQQAFYVPRWAEYAQHLAQLSTGVVTTEPTPPPTSYLTTMSAVVCSDWSLPVRDYREYAARLHTMRRIAPDMRYHPTGLYAVSGCLGAPQPVPNPQHELTVRLDTPILLAGTRHDPATPYRWARNVADQLGDQAVLLTYAGWGHGSYTRSSCMSDAIDRYLIARTVPAGAPTCPAV